MPIAAAFTTIEAAYLPVAAMDHLEHSRCQMVTTLWKYLLYKCPISDERLQELKVPLQEDGAMGMDTLRFILE